ncbi:hypothetical protein KL911_002872 [Ogataea haglerorum]|uniref:uncharacterized protein n=1 Tax=Ogataea haglerorum TaxID=1937702 RepID=UPI001C8A864B|nr:uncharacterized protein KL911_002872 [Ogataea haglerorum]KAG7753479.1 hypothetical protein KL911_002872 [Ogataea haglerorum]
MGQTGSAYHHECLICHWINNGADFRSQVVTPGNEAVNEIGHAGIPKETQSPSGLSRNHQIPDHRRGNESRERQRIGDGVETFTNFGKSRNCCALLVTLRSHKYAAGGAGREPENYLSANRPAHSCQFERSPNKRNISNTVPDQHFSTKNNSMNVLVYNGPGAASDSVKHCLDTLRLLLSPYYAVAPVEPRTLLSQPWQAKTAMVVIPGGADLGVCSTLNGTGNQKIRQFVSAGGKYIGFCSGGYYASARCEFEVGNPNMEVSGARELKFFPGVARGASFKGFEYGTEEGTRPAKLKTHFAVQQPLYNYYNGGAVFVDADKHPNTQILAEYEESVEVECPGPQAAVILCSVGQGKALLTGTHPEYNPTLLEAEPGTDFEKSSKVLKEHDAARLEFMRHCLRSLGLKVNEESTRPALTPLVLISRQKEQLAKLVYDLEHKLGYESENIIDLGKDKIRVHKTLDKFQQTDLSDPEMAVKDFYICDAALPKPELTPYFNTHQYLTELEEAYKELGYSSVGELGSIIVYGEVLTSSSSLMMYNTPFMRILPHGFAIVGTVQVAGRGRTGNVWVNPKGVFAMTLFLKMPLTTPVVLLQYLVSMSMVQAVQTYGVGYEKIPIRLKWPNDIYILRPDCLNKTDLDSYTKIGGILVETAVFENNYHIAIGTGLNVFNQGPTTSLNAVISEMNKTFGTKLKPIATEKLTAKYLSILYTMLERFKVEGMEPFMDLYYRQWLHSGQKVTLDHPGSPKAVITGISKEFGLLTAKEVDRYGNFTGNTYELQPDGNAFDMFRGLISKKL